MSERRLYQGPISELSPPKLELADASLSMKEVILMMSSKAQGCLFAKSGEGHSGKIGILTEREILFNYDPTRPVEEYPLSELLVGKSRFHQLDLSCEEALRFLLIRDQRYLPIRDGENYFIIGVRDFFKWSMNRLREYIDRYDVLKGFNEKAPLILKEDYEFLGGDEKSRAEFFFSSQLSKLSLLPCLRVDHQATVEEVLTLMRERMASACTIVQYETLLRGIITERDFLMKIFPQDWNQVRSRPITEFMTPNPHALSPKHPMGVAVQNFLAHRYRNLVIIDEERFPIYIMGVGDIFKEYLRTVGVLEREELSKIALSA